MVHDVLPGIEAGLEAFAVADGAVILQRAIQAGEHLVSLAVADLVHAFGREQGGDDLRPIGLFPGAEDVLAEVQVAGFAC